MKFRTLVVTLAAAVATTGLGTAPSQATIGEPATLRFTADLPLYGTGEPSLGTLAGTFTGTVNGHAFTNASFTASFTHQEQLCPLQGTAIGTYVLKDEQLVITNVFDWVQTATFGCMWIRLPDGTYIHICGPFLTSPAGNPCGGGPVTVTFTGAGANAG